MDSRRAGVSDEAVKGCTEGVACEPGLADGWDLGSRSGQGEEGCTCREGGLHTAGLVPQVGLFLFVCQEERALWHRAL